MSATGAKLRTFWRVMGLGILLVVYVALSACTTSAGARAVEVTPTTEPPGPIVITITNRNVEAAIARILGTNQIDTMDGDVLTFNSCSDKQFISVWAEGFYVETISCNGSPKHEYQVTLTSLPTVDNPDYVWMDAGRNATGVLYCNSCHSDSASGLNEYTDWHVDGHSNVFTKPYFWSIYTGTNINNGAISPDNLGYRLDFPDQNGNCFFCHAPAALQSLQRGTGSVGWNASWPEMRTNVETQGVTCDVCHKATDVLIGENGRPIAERPGVLSFELVRPPADELFYVGPWPDHRSENIPNPGSAQHSTACSPVFSEGKFCAACHYGKFYDTVIYNSYGEWLDSIYSKQVINGEENKLYRSCQDCHMQPSQGIGESSIAQRSACSPENQSFRDFSHNMMKRDNQGNPVIIQNAASVSVEAREEQGKIKVTVKVINMSAGHKFPTDSPLRHLILVVEAKDKDGKLLAQAEGTTIPEWGGTGDQPQDYAGKPGVIYANLLKDKVTNEVPAISFWNTIAPAWEGSDTRLLPRVEVESNYAFAAPSRGRVDVTAQLIYRYAFIEIMRQKGWDRPDVLVNWDNDFVE